MKKYFNHPVCTPCEAHHAYWGIILMNLFFILQFSQSFSMYTMTCTTFILTLSFFLLFYSKYYAMSTGVVAIILWIMSHTVYILLYSTKNLWTISILVIGWLLYIDDYYQHYKQWNNLSYISPIHKFVYDVLKINQIKWIKNFTIWVDKLFGKK